MRNYNTSSKVEAYFQGLDEFGKNDKSFRKIQCITVDNYIELGQLTALRFLEWVCLNPGGVVALPTGKTPEFFIKWMEYYLQNWDRELKNGLLHKIGFEPGVKPDFKSLYFFQLDEFFPISPKHERSFTYFVKKYYIEGFGFDLKKTRLINTYSFNNAQQELLGNIQNVDEVFPDGIIDLSLRIKKPVTESEVRKQKTIKYFDQFCAEYEDEIRDLGGIGFFLGGIGPDGHIAFNVRGSSHHSHTRLTNINYETQAAASGDLGGIEAVRKKAVITIGLETITYNPDTVAIIIVAGESKAKVALNAVEKGAKLEYPASVLQKLPNARFFLTESAGIYLSKSLASYKKIHEQDVENTLLEKLVIDGARETNSSLMEIARSGNKNSTNIENDYFSMARRLSLKQNDALAESVFESISKKIERGLKIPNNQRILHTAPHHDDIELAYFPYLHHLVRSSVNQNYFAYCTSGFTAVTNAYVLECLTNALKHFTDNSIDYKVNVKNLWNWKYAWDDITGYLNGIAMQDEEVKETHISARIFRKLFNHFETKETEDVKQHIIELIALFEKLTPGRKEPDIAHKLKGWIREFEAELVWAHFGLDMRYVSHLNLHFYSDDIFPQYPDFEHDVKPILNLLEDIKPTIVTLALDPEGSGPDTHYKTLIALAEAIDKYVEAHPDLNLRVWGYRNVWSRYHLSDVNMVIPVSLNSFAVLHNMFNSCFVSQKSASFPSYEWDGAFSELAQKIWVEQHNQLVQLMGNEYFYDSPNPMLKRAFGAIYLKDMSYKEFKQRMVPVRRLLKAKKMLES